MEEMIKNAILSSTVYPLLVGFILTAALGKFVKTDSKRDWIAGLALAGAFLTTFYSSAGFPDFPPVRVLNWTPTLVIAALILCSLLPPNKSAFHMVLGMAFSAVATYLFLNPLGQGWEGSTHADWFVLSFILISLLHVVANSENEAENGQQRLFMMVVFATGISLISIISESAKVAQITGGLAASCGAVFLGRLVAKDIPVGRIVNGVFLAAIACLILNVYHYVEAPGWAMLVVMLAHVARLVLRHPSLMAMSGLKRGAIAVIIALLPVIVTVAALGMNEMAAAEAAGDDEYDYEY